MKGDDQVAHFARDYGRVQPFLFTLSRNSVKCSHLGTKSLLFTTYLLFLCGN